MKEPEPVKQEQPVIDEEDFRLSESVVEDAKDIDLEKMFEFHQITDVNQAVELAAFPNIGTPPILQSPKHFHSNIKVFRGDPTEKFVWNSYLLEGLKDQVHPDWLLNITHGFVGQSSMFSHIFCDNVNRTIFLEILPKDLHKIGFLFVGINPFQANVSYLYPLKLSEISRFSDVFRVYRNGTLA